MGKMLEAVLWLDVGGGFGVSFRKLPLVDGNLRVSLRELRVMQFTITGGSCCYSLYISFSFHQVPVTAGWSEAAWIQSMPKASIHDRVQGNRTQE